MFAKAGEGQRKKDSLLIGTEKGRGEAQGRERGRTGLAFKEMARIVGEVLRVCIRRATERIFSARGTDSPTNSSEVI